MLGRLSRPADFESVLATPVKARSAHFAAHHLPRCPDGRKRRAHRSDGEQLSTGDPDRCAQAVDDVFASSWWFGVIVPKRHARKAITRSLLRRQMKGALARHHTRLARGMWLLRLRSPFDPQQFSAAASAALAGAARAELDGLLTRAAA